eukprot:NODE_4586_length_461_cov_27.334951_g3958_i0.p1 GENE.NODE_4586_length_461_cov_27.334951_g3958_i0~~NODE_4586_length_461_cov_27.334951_g3958_i0.p1  ORF type:complete len:110 (-),score=9.25 NODE_4586_length_461_cov_27.334951_g3958_i0:66-395(-)
MSIHIHEFLHNVTLSPAASRNSVMGLSLHHRPMMCYGTPITTIAPNPFIGPPEHLVADLPSVCCPYHINRSCIVWHITPYSGLLMAPDLLSQCIAHTLLCHNCDPGMLL